jgi:two-component system cell cycle response regulator
MSSMTSRPPLSPMLVDRQTKLSLSSDRPSAPKQPCLVIVSGPAAGQRIDLQQDELVIGRGEECAVRVVDDSVSRRHAVITRVLDRWILLDLESTNGTFVDDRRIERAELKGGELLRVGKVALKYIRDSLELDYIRHVLNVANTDALTGLYNRGYFDEFLGKELARLAASPEACSLILFDIDHFKRINDGFGHRAGDAVLGHLASLTKSQLDRGELLFRTGGEEFAVVLPSTAYSFALETAELLRQAVETAVFDFDAAPIQVTVSLGVAGFEAGDDVARLYQRADERLYVAKRGGRNRVA